MNMVYFLVMLKKRDTLVMMYLVINVQAAASVFEPHPQLGGKILGVVAYSRLKTNNDSCHPDK